MSAVLAVAILCLNEILTIRSVRLYMIVFSLYYSVQF